MEGRKRVGILMNPQNMSWDEKIRGMEELWESLSREEVRLESPPWQVGACRSASSRSADPVRVFGGSRMHWPATMIQGKETWASA